jgi:hypothetical protein
MQQQKIDTSPAIVEEIETPSDGDDASQGSRQSNVPNVHKHGGLHGGPPDQTRLGEPEHELVRYLWTREGE